MRRGDYGGDRGGGRPTDQQLRRGDFDRRPPFDRQVDERRAPPPGFDHRRLGPGQGPPPSRGPGGDTLPALRSAVNAVPAEPPIDREKVCPLLLRVFPRVGAHHRLEEFSRRGDEPKEEIQIYTWPDATLRELCELVKEVNATARRPASKVSFAFIYPDRSGRNVMRQAGVVHSTRPGADDAATLRSLKFQPGDFLSVAIY